MSDRVDRAQAKGLLASKLALTGAVVAGIPGAAIGGLVGLIVGDEDLVFTIDMVAIPAFQAYMLNGTPSAMVYIKAGETLKATGGNVEDVQQVLGDKPKTRVKRRKLNAYQRFTKTFAFRNKRKNENSRLYFAARSKALSRAWKKKKGGK